MIFEEKWRKIKDCRSSPHSPEFTGFSHFNNIVEKYIIMSSLKKEVDYYENSFISS
jgi:hypothetical protein